MFPFYFPIKSTNCGFINIPYLDPMAHGFVTAQGDQQSSKAESEPKEVKAETEEKEEKDLEENNEG